MSFPLATLELARAGRRRRIYALRMVVGVGALLIMIGVSQEGPMIGAGDALAKIATAFQFAVVFIMAPLMTAGSIAQEKQEKTLGLLLLADMRGWDILLAKWLASFMQTATLVLSTWPLLAISSFFGGVELPAMTLQTSLLLAASASVVAIALLCSTVCARPGDALLLTTGVLAFWLGATALFDYFGSSNAYSLWNIVLASYRPASWRHPGYDWLPALGLTLALGVISAIATGVLLPRQAFDRPLSATARRPASRGLTWALISRNPAAPLIYASMRDASILNRSRWLRIATSFSLIPIAIIPGAGLLIMISIVTYRTVSSLRWAAEQGATADLAMTPLSDRDLAEASLWAVVVQNLYLLIPYLFSNPAWLADLIMLLRVGANTGPRIAMFSFHSAVSIIALSALFSFTVVTSADLSIHSASSAPLIAWTYHGMLLLLGVALGIGVAIQAESFWAIVTGFYVCLTILFGVASWLMFLAYAGSKPRLWATNLRL